MLIRDLLIALMLRTAQFHELLTYKSVPELPNSMSSVKDLIWLFVRRFVEVLLRVFGEDVVSVAVFGSVARGDFTCTSDVDVLIVMRSVPRSRFRRYELVSRAVDAVEDLRCELARRGMYTGISPVVLSVEEAKYFRPLYLDLVEDAVILYDRDDFLRRILERVRYYIELFGGKRVWLGRRWYWIFERGNPFIELVGVKLVE